MAAKYVIGIDLGTTNSVLAYAPLEADRPAIELLPIPQLISAGTVESRTTLPSFLYLAAEHESDKGTYDFTLGAATSAATTWISRWRTTLPAGSPSKA